MTDSQRMLKILGVDAMQRLCDEFGGSMVYIPSRVPDPARDEKARTLYVANLQAGSTCMSSYRSVAEALDLSVRRVQQIVSS